jgi:hypothetical protein
MRTTLLGVLLLAAGCASEDPDTAPSTTTTTTVATTHTPTTTAVPAVVDLINPSAGTLGGVQVGHGPVEPMIEALTSTYGEPEQDSGWRVDPCTGAPQTRGVFWESLDVYLEEAEGEQRLLGFTWDQSDQADEPIELPEGIVLGMPYSDAAAVNPDGAYTHDSLELDGVVLQEDPTLIVVGQHTADGSGPLTQVWVGAIPTCS